MMSAAQAPPLDPQAIAASAISIAMAGQKRCIAMASSLVLIVKGGPRSMSPVDDIIMARRPRIVVGGRIMAGAPAHRGGEWHAKDHMVGARSRNRYAVDRRFRGCRGPEGVRWRPFPRQRPAPGAGLQQQDRDSRELHARQHR